MDKILLIMGIAVVLAFFLAVFAITTKDRTTTQAISEIKENIQAEISKEANMLEQKTPAQKQDAAGTDPRPGASAGSPIPAPPIEIIQPPEPDPLTPSAVPMPTMEITPVPIP